MTVLENLEMGAYLRKDKPEIARDLRWYMTFFGSFGPAKQPAGTLSGEQQMLAIGRALMSQLKLLDEPSMGLAPLLVQEIFNNKRCKQGGYNRAAG